MVKNLLIAVHCQGKFAIPKIDKVRRLEGLEYRINNDTFAWHVHPGSNLKTIFVISAVESRNMAENLRISVYLLLDVPELPIYSVSLFVNLLLRIL